MLPRQLHGSLLPCWPVCAPPPSSLTPTPTRVFCMLMPSPLLAFAGKTVATPGVPWVALARYRSGALWPQEPGPLFSRPYMSHILLHSASFWAGRAAMAGPFPDWAGRTSGWGLDDGVVILRWYAGEARRRKGASVSNRRGRRVCGEGVWAPAYAGVTGGMERRGDVPSRGRPCADVAGWGGSCRWTAGRERG